METYLFYLIIKRLSTILSKKDFGVIVLSLFSSLLDNAIVEGKGIKKGFVTDGPYNLKNARAVCQVCIYHGFYMETFVMTTTRIRANRPSGFSIYRLLREELALAKKKTKETSLPMLRYSLFREGQK